MGASSNGALSEISAETVRFVFQSRVLADPV